MSKFISRKNIFALIFCILLVGMQSVFAQNFNNNLLKADVNKNSLGGVKVTLYTSKPYKDSVVANKKSDNEYVILMPETANSLTSKPSLNAASDVIRNVEIKTQQYNGNVKGYTKILITTTKPVEVIPQVQTLNTSHYVLSEKDYKELLAQSAKTKPAVKKEIKPVVAVKKEVVAPKSNKAVIEKAQKSNSSITSKITNKIQSIAKNDSRRKRVTQERETKVSTKNVIKHRKNRHATFAQKTEPVVTKKVAKKEIKIEKPKEIAKVVPEVQPAVKPPVAETKVATQPTEKIISAPVTAPPVAKMPKQFNNIKLHQVGLVLTEYVPGVTPARLHKAKALAKSNFYNLIAIFSIGFIVLLLIARKMTKSMRGNKTSFVKNLEDKPFVPTDLESKISDDMTWKEKFQTYVDSTSPNITDEDIEIKPVSSNEDLDELFGSETKEETNIAESEVIHMDSEVSSLIKESESIINEENVVPTSATEKFEDDSFLSELDQISGGNYNFDEEASVEDVFGEDEDTGIPVPVVEESIEEEPLIDLEAERFLLNPEDTELPSHPEVAPIPLVQELSAVPPIVAPMDETSALDELVAEEPEEVVKSEFEIDDGKYFYLVDYDEKTSLVGQIDDEIFVLKNFDFKVDDKLQARLNEQKGNTSSYMTRVGNFKALVEVTPDNMNLLIEL